MKKNLGLNYMQFYKTCLLLNISSKTLDINAKELKSDYGDFDKRSWERITNM